MTPAKAIAMLDRQIARHGEAVVYHVMTGGAAGAGTDLRAFVRKYDPTEVVGTITERDRKVTVSPSSGLVPSEGNRFVISGKAYRIEDAEPVRLDGVVVRFNVRARG